MKQTLEMTSKLAKDLESTTLRRISILRMKDLQARIGLSRAAIYYFLDKSGSRYDPSFPRPVKLSSHSIGFYDFEVDAWLASRPRAGN